MQNDDNNELVTNHCENNINNSSLEDDDEPPPLPPPRGASLTRSVLSDMTPSPTTENGKIPVSKEFFFTKNFNLKINKNFDSVMVYIPSNKLDKYYSGKYIFLVLFI